MTPAFPWQLLALCGAGAWTDEATASGPGAPFPTPSRRAARRGPRAQVMS